MSTSMRRRATGGEASEDLQAFQERMAELEGRLAARMEERLATQRAELEGRLAIQQAEIERLRAERVEAAPASSLILPAQFRDRGAGDVAPENPRGRRASRRGLLKLGGAAAAAGVAAGLMGRPQAAHAAPVPTGGSLILGQVNDAGATTLLTASASTTPGLILDVEQPVWGGDAISGSATGLNGAAIKAEAFDQAFGVYATCDNGVGVQGRSTSGTGVYGLSDSGIGVQGTSGTSIDVAADGTGRFWQSLQFAAWPPSTGTYQAGEQIRDANGDLWICVAGNGTDPGQWRKVAAPQFKYAGGALNLLPVPIRLLDTRAGAPVGFALPNAPIGYHGTLQMQAAGLTFQGQAIPPSATAVFGNLVVALAPGVNPGDGSSLICWPNGQPRPAAVNIVFNPGDLHGEYTSTFTLVAIGTSNLVNIYSQPIIPGVAVDVIFDAFGFVM